MLVQINGYTVINSAALPGEGRGTVILGVKSLNVNSDDYEYVVAEVKDFPTDTGWPQGDYSRTLDLALQRFNDRVETAKGYEPDSRMSVTARTQVRYCTVHETAHYEGSEVASCKIEMRTPYRVKGGVTYI